MKGWRAGSYIVLKGKGPKDNSDKTICHFTDQLVWEIMNTKHDDGDMQVNPPTPLKKPPPKHVARLAGNVPQEIATTNESSNVSALSKSSGGVHEIELIEANVDGNRRKRQRCSVCKTGQTRFWCNQCKLYVCQNGGGGKNGAPVKYCWSQHLQKVSSSPHGCLEKTV